jgi:uncharacterized protein (DUF302 family)
MTSGIKSKSILEQSDRVQHTSVFTGQRYAAAIRDFEKELGHLDPQVTQRLVKQKTAWSEVEREITAIGGVHDLMIISQLDLGRVASLSGREKLCSLYLVGNPVIATRIIGIDIRGSFYVPFRVALYDDGNPDGAVISYDRPSSFLATLGHPELTAIGEDLDKKIDAVAAAVRGI